jgi:lipid II:glycine glycyltransferase (peptidoglycan interpeptide bridge formation enzyme)
VTQPAAAAPAVREVTGPALDRWDAEAVDVPGGHVLQSRAWAEHRAATGWRPVHLAVDEQRALALVRGWPLLPGGSAYVPRGPVGPGEPWGAAPRADRAVQPDAAGTAIASALVAVTGHLAMAGIDVVAADPEVAGDDTRYAAAIRRAGFHAIPEIQPSRHRMSLALPADGDDASVLEGVAKATRQRIRRAERDGVCVVRWDAAPTQIEGTRKPAEDVGAALDRFYGLLRATGDRKGFTLGGAAGFTAWWRRAHAAGHLVYLEAREGAADGDVLGGLVLYRHGRRLSTVHSGDRAERRRDHPGAMHLLRWRAIELALAERRTEMDLGGVDIAGARRRPAPGEPTYGLYEHKLSFGAEWVELAGAQERVIRRTRYAAGRAASKVARLAGRGSAG